MMIVNFDEIESMHPNAGGGSVFFFEDKPFTGLIVEYNEDDILVGEISVVNGNKEGKISLYYNSGQIMVEHFEKFNRPYGICRKWDEGGNLISEYDFGSEFTP